MRYLPAILSLLLLFNCSEDETESSIECQSENTGTISMEDSFAYTGDQIIVKGEFCLDRSLKVLINDVDYDLMETTSTQISFIMPDLVEDSVLIKIQSDGVVLDFSKKIAVYPGNGTWQEVASFPGAARGFTKSTSVDNVGYLIGGSDYLGHTEELGYAYDYYTDLYQYSETADTWTLIANDDNFKDKNYFIGNGGSLYLFPFSPLAGIPRYELNTSNFETIGSIGSSGSFHPFSVEGDIFVFSVENHAVLTLRKYSSTNNEWQAVSTYNLGVPLDSHVIVDFAFVRDGMAYLGYNLLNSNELVLLSVNMEDLVIGESARVEIMYQDILLVKYLFAIDDLAYFIEIGSSSIGPGLSDVDEPGDHLYIFNLKSNSWKISEHSLPESFLGTVSFGLNNRGFSGMGTSANSPLFSYSQKFYEFIPK